jgi:hypothetical protein
LPVGSLRPLASTLNLLPLSVGGRSRLLP